MKGKLLKNEEGKWSVQYFIPPTVNNLGWINTDSHFTELPLHPDDAKQLEIGFTDKFTSEVEFEIVEYNIPGSSYINSKETKFAKLITSPKKGSFDEDEFAITRVIDDKQEKTTTSWDKIIQEWSDLQTQLPFIEYLKKLYYPPVKK